jgi:hypothetical protein
MSDKFQKIIYSAIVFIYIILINKVPISIYSNAIHDDALFISRAQNIVAGNWAGPAYNQFILAKGLGFSLFEALNYYLGLPITLTIALINIAMTFFIVNTINKFNKSKYFSIIIFAVLLFSPILIPQRIIRDNIYGALTIFTFIGLIRILLKIDISKKISLIYGIFFGIFWITREEAVWIIPSIVIALIILFSKNKINYIKSIGLNLFIFITSAFIFITIISGINYIKYNIYSSNDFNEKSFQSALNGLYSVRSGEVVPYLPVSKNKRELLYGVSPKFNELKSYFEGSGMGWTNFGCEEYPQTCGDYASGWFVWALRDAVASKGYYSTSSKARNFYDELSSEISSACSAEKIICDKRYFGFLPPVAIGQWAQFIPAVYIGFKRLAYFGGSELPSNSTGPINKINEYSEFLGRPLINIENQGQNIYVSGWVQSNMNKWFRLDCRTRNGLLSIYPSREISPDIIINGFHINDVRFSFNVNKNDNCTLITDDNSGTFKINDYINSPGMKKIGNYSFQFDNLYQEKNKKNFVLDINFLFNIYKLITPLIVILGIFCLIYDLFSNKNKNYNLFVFIISLWTLIFSRLILLGMVDISSHHAINFQYLEPLFIPILVVSFLSIASAIKNFQKSKEK